MAFVHTQPRKKPTQSNLFPTFDTVEEAEAHAYSRVPVSSHNEMHSILMSYKNTVLSQHEFEDHTQN